MNTSGVTSVTRMMSTVNNNNNNNCNHNNNKITSNNNNLKMNLQLNKMQCLEFNRNAAAATAATSTVTAATTTSPTASPPDFDFNLPCRYFKSSFARSLSLNNASNHCKSLDYEQRGGVGGNTNNNHNDNNIMRNNCPPLPQRLSRAAAVGDNNCSNNNNNFVKNEVGCDAASKHNSNNNHNNRPPAIPARRLPAATFHSELPPQQQQQQQRVPLTQFRNAAASNSHGAHFNKINNQQQQLPHVASNQHHNNNSHQHNISNIISSNNISSNLNNSRRNHVWPRDSEQNVDANPDDEDDDGLYTDEAPEHELTQISNADYMLQQQQQRGGGGGFEPHEDVVNVEAVLLQNQVDTLQWQLKQVETSCEMYRAVMEEVARFLDRYHSQRLTRPHQLHGSGNNNTEQITRSKSMYHVYGGGVDGAGDDDDYDVHNKTTDCSDEAPPAATAYLRSRSSTNLIDLKQTATMTTTQPTPKTKAKSTKAATTKPPRGGVEEHVYDVIAPANSYNAFKDFTWRRSPKKLNDSRTLCSAADVEEKLNQEAFRLSRTIHNLLNTSTQQPDLRQHRNSLGRLSKTHASASIMTLNQPLHNSTSLTMAGVGGCVPANNEAAPKSCTNSNNNQLAATAEMLFLRSLNMRDSRLSLRSSTDSSVHSTSSSSKVETDEEHTHYAHSSPPTPSLHTHPHSAPKPIPQLGSTTEDESGFSSINSFQDIGVPFSSTLISTPRGKTRPQPPVPPPSQQQQQPLQQVTDTANVDNSRNSTLKSLPPLPPVPAQRQASSNVVGLPLQATHDMQHRWDASPAKTYRSAPNKFQQRFSTLSNEDSATVLWV